MTRRGPGLLGTCFLVLSAGFLGAGLLLPGAAEALLRLYLPALALAFLLVRADDARLPRTMEQDRYSPFLHDRDGPAPSPLPRVIQERARPLAALDDPDRAPAPVPIATRWLLIDAFTRRLAERRGLHLADPSHHEAIRGLLSERAWGLVRPPGLDDSDRAPVALHHLDAILDDLEKL